MNFVTGALDTSVRSHNVLHEHALRRYSRIDKMQARLPRLSLLGCFLDTPYTRWRGLLEESHPLEGDPRHVVLLEDTVDCRQRHVHLMIAGQEHREPLDAVLPFLSQPQNQCLELGRDAMRADTGPAPVFAQTWGPSFRYRVIQK